MPPRPLFVHEIIPKAIAVLQQHQQRIEQITSAGGYVDGHEHTHVLDLCKQILDSAQPKPTVPDSRRQKTTG